MRSFRQILEDIPNCPNGGYLCALTSNNMVVNSAEDLPPEKKCSNCRWAKSYDEKYVECSHPYISKGTKRMLQPKDCGFWRGK